MENAPAPPAGLVIIDWILAASGLILLLIAASRTALGPRRDPLADAPLRPHQLREDAVLLAVGVYLLAAVVLGAIMAQVLPDSNDVRTRLVVGNGAQLAGIAACLVVIGRRFGGGTATFVFGPPRHRVRRFGGTVGWVLVVGIGVCPLLAEGTIRLIHALAPSLPLAPHPTLAALHNDVQPGWITAGLWIGAAVVAPVAEEIFFRGLLQSVLLGVLRSRWVTILVASVAFGAVHVSQLHTVGALVVLGVLLGYAYERTGSIVPPILVHSLFNLKTLVWDALGAASPG